VRSLILSATALLAACAPAPIPERGSAGGYACRQQAFEEFIGQVASSEVGAEMLRVSGARVIRWVRPGTRVAMDYRADRLTVRLADNNRIIIVSCG
jgi:hypothetical protein